MHHDASHTSKTVSLIVALIVLLLVAAVFLYGIILGIHAQMKGGVLHVKGPLFEESVPLDEITHLSLDEHVAYGSRVGGADFVKLKTGTFQNTVFGRYRCAVYTTPKCCIVVTTDVGRILVFNLETDEQTRTFFAQLQEAVQ